MADSLDQHPVLHPELVLPNAVEVVGAIHDNLVTCFRNDTQPNIDFPSIWRLAKIVTGEVTPLLVYRFKPNP